MKTRLTGLGDVGLVSDKLSYGRADGSWDELSNCRCRHGAIEPVDGYTDVTSETNTGSEEVYIHSVTAVQNATAFYFVYGYDSTGNGTANKISSYNGGSVSDITRSTGGDYGTGTWESTGWNGLVIMTNGNDEPQYTNGSADCLPLDYDSSNTWDDENLSAAVIRGYGPFLFALNISSGATDYLNMVWWSDAADPNSIPSSWDYTDTTNLAGRTILAETNGAVLDAVTLGESLIIYKEDAIYRCNFVENSDFVFDFQVMSTSHGLWSTNCVVDTGVAGHFCLGDGIVYRHSGGAIENLLEGRAAEALFSKIDASEYTKAFLAHYKAQNEVWICYPQLGETWANKAMCFNYVTGTWFERDIPKCSAMVQGLVEGVEPSPEWDDYTTETWQDAQFAAPWSTRGYSPIGDTLVAAGDQLIKFDEGVTSDPVIATRYNIDFGEPDEWAMMTRIMPHVDGGDITLTLGTQDTPNGPHQFVESTTFNADNDYKWDVRTTAKVFAIRLSGNNAWRASGVTFEYEPAGIR